ncbi:MAG: hypothetical protein QM570_15410 [Planctomycetota bacterium]|jgi:hypothetical protein|nr:hypothetical protein [Planctomycetota bacterium]
MSIQVQPHHPLAEVLGKKLCGIEAVPRDEQSRMVQRAICAAVEYHTAEIAKLTAERDAMRICVEELELERECRGSVGPG